MARVYLQCTQGLPTHILRVHHLHTQGVPIGFTKSKEEELESRVIPSDYLPLAMCVCVQEDVRRLLGLEPDQVFDITFECKVPGTAQDSYLQLKGLEAYHAAGGCSSVAAWMGLLLSVPLLLRPAAAPPIPHCLFLPPCVPPHPLPATLCPTRPLSPSPPLPYQHLNTPP